MAETAERHEHVRYFDANDPLASCEGGFEAQFSDLIHLTADGNRCLARIFAREMEATGLLAPRERGTP
ncbi:MAG: hypothetical protein M5R36_06630 [Deltaproteobacteria bacterium]|nr:hypothetical protein [Deltaproteobacteria bacterium]